MNKMYIKKVSKQDVPIILKTSWAVK